jgi:hypothetical protein
MKVVQAGEVPHTSQAAASEAMIPYAGNALYCFADSTAMLLATIGERIPATLIEVLTGVGLGAIWMDKAKTLLFSQTLPDVGVSQALTLLGFEFTEKAQRDAEPAPLDELRADLAQSPALLGPLDMSYLSYQPWEEPEVADHYMLAYAMDGSEIYLHDPLGFPYVSLPLPQLAQAWKAERIEYGRGHYRYWLAPRRVRQPTDDELYDGALRSFRAGYESTAGLAPQRNWLIGGQAIRAGAEHVRGDDISPAEVERMQSFSFQLGTTRALDSAAFFAPHSAALAALKDRQARLFGRCHVLARRRQWPTLAGIMEDLAGVEERFQAALFAG